jgi:cytochrome P450
MAKLLLGHFVHPEELVDLDKKYEWYQKMRSESPICFDSKRNCWDVFTYQEVKKVVTDYKLFSSKRSEINVDSIIGMDPPEHTKKRSLVSKEFGHRHIKRLESSILSVTQQVLDDLANSHSSDIDVMNGLADRIPILVIMNLLGIHEDYFQEIKKWSKASTTRSHSDKRGIKNMKALKEGTYHLNQILEQIIKERQNNPGNDLISLMLSKNNNDLTFDELRDYCRAILVGGSETAVNLIGNFIYLLLTHPQEKEQLQKDLSLMPKAVEEALRYASSVQCINRIAIQDVTLGDQLIKAGQEVVVWLGSANRDENVFTDPEQFQIDRSPNPHLAFSQGIHTCLGNSLARLETKIIITTLLQRFPMIKLSRTKKPVPNTNFVFLGFDHLYVNLR